MGLFSKKTPVSRDAFNICFLSKKLFLETTDWVITKDSYVPEYMNRVTAFLIDDSLINDPSQNSYRVRIDIKDVLEFKIEPTGSDSTMSGMISTAKKICPHIENFNKVTIKTKEKEYNFDFVADTISNNDILAANKDFDKVVEKSCLWSLLVLCEKD